MEPKTFISRSGLYYPGILHEVKKSSEALAPVYEAFTNSLEAIIQKGDSTGNRGQITIKIFSIPGLDQESLFFAKMLIEDNGVGFTKENFDRLLTYKDDRKGFKNKGSGRLQLVHYFNKSIYESIYQDNGKFKKTSFILSKSEDFLRNNSIVYYIGTEDITSNEPSTVLTLQELLEGSENFYNELTSGKLKQFFVNRYMMYFCAHRNSLPLIKIQHYKDHELLTEDLITDSDIPNEDNHQTFTINYSAIAADAKTIQHIPSKYEEFVIRAFKIPKSQLEKNAIKFTSKGEIVEKFEVPLSVISPEEHVNDSRFLFLLSSNYIDERDSNVRGNLRIPDREKFKKQGDLFSTEEILLEDIQDSSNARVLTMYKEIEKVQEEKNKKFEKLREMFLFSDETVSELSIGLNDTEDKILEKVYSAEAKVVAKQDAQLKKKIEELDQMNPSDVNYRKTLEEKIKTLVKQIPLQNRTTLTHYIARRKLVLELFNKVLKRGLEIQSKDNENIDEKLLHNLIFQQSSESPETSDLWIVNEDFIYFNGVSEAKLGDVKLGGKKVFKKELNQEEENHRKSQKEDRYLKRTDVLLFPEENKCIIIEFKNPEVNLSEHLNQINRYASLIRNFSKDEFNFDTFYGYLIGENMNPEDVIDFDSDYKKSYQFDYVFRPAKPIIGKFGRENGSLYTEVLKYSTLLKRAQKRNEIFLKKLGIEEKAK